MSAIISPSTIKTTLAVRLYDCPSIHAAALYGSSARGDAESYSDLDVLVVCEGSKKRETHAYIEAGLRATFNNLSVSIYTPRELTFLAKVQSLFLLHLSRECIVLFDHTGLLTHLLTTFEPKRSYRGDFQQSLDLIAPLWSVVEGSPNQYHRLAYIYSLFRVFGVYLLAEDGVYEFSKAKMVHGLAKKYPFRSQELALLASLRSLNMRFFSGDDFGITLSPENSRLIYADALGALGAFLEKRIVSATRSYRDAVAEFVAICNRESRRLGYRLRTWFLLLVYDGLNLFCQLENRPPLISFNERRLSELTDSDFPDVVRRAAFEALDYHRNYPLKYFLLEQSKIPVAQACQALSLLADFLPDIAGPSF